MEIPPCEAEDPSAPNDEVVLSTQVALPVSSAGVKVEPINLDDQPKVRVDEIDEGESAISR